MAKIKLSQATFSLIPEGTHTFKVMEVNDEKYEDYGKLEVKLQTAKGETHYERFSLLTSNGEVHEGALKAWSYFARTCLNNFQADEIDTKDIVDCYITATVKHENYKITKGDRAGQDGTAVRLNDYTPSAGFGGSTTELEEDFDDLDDLDDLD